MCFVFVGTVLIYVSLKRRKKLYCLAEKLSFVAYLEGSKVQMFWDQINNMFVKSAHEEWLTEPSLGIECDTPETLVLNPAPPSTIGNVLNFIEWKEDKLLDARQVKYELED